MMLNQPGVSGRPPSGDARLGSVRAGRRSMLIWLSALHLQVLAQGSVEEKGENARLVRWASAMPAMPGAPVWHRLPKPALSTAGLLCGRDGHR
jgi:hypothetical protein